MTIIRFNDKSNFLVAHRYLDLLIYKAKFMNSDYYIKHNKQCRN